MMRALAAVVAIGLLGGAAALVHQGPAIAAGALLHPSRRTELPVRPQGCSDREYLSDGVVLRGWSCAAEGSRRGTLVFLHGVADNRGSGVGAILRFTARGWDVVAYDSRAHGASDGEACTYGHFEKQDLHHVLESVAPGPVVLLGTSLGAAVAIQAALDSRVAGVVAAEVFSDLESVSRDRAPSFLPEWMIVDAFALAEMRGGFRIASASPEAAAPSIRVPVLLVHGERDTETPPAHSQRVYQALGGRKHLVLVPGAGHNQSLHSNAVWTDITSWIDDVIMKGVS